MAADAKFTELAKMIKRGDMDSFRAQVERSDFDVNTQDHNDLTVLHVATKMDNPEAVGILLQIKSIDANLKNNKGYNPLMESCVNARIKALQVLLNHDKVDIDELDSSYNTIEDLVDQSKFGAASKSKMKETIHKRRAKNESADDSERQAIVIINSGYVPNTDPTEVQWDPLEGPIKDGKLLKKMFEDNHYKVHEILDTEDVLKSVKEVMATIDRSTLKMMHVVYSGEPHFGKSPSTFPSGHGGVMNDVEVAGQGGVIFGEVLVGISGKKAFVVHLVRLVTDSRTDNPEDVAIYNFMFDMCRTETKEGKLVVKNRNFDFDVELQRKGLSMRVCQIFAAQIGVVASGDDSLVQRMAEYLKEHGIKSMLIRDIRSGWHEARAPKSNQLKHRLKNMASSQFSSGTSTRRDAGKRLR